jgi:A/G-specific adenine glycosylase
VVKNLSGFKKIVWAHYKKHGRVLPWRETRDPYKILVSEIMLQQTQVDRVLPKYKSFLRRFPTFETLANASTANVIREWQGLGYNRRAVNLKKAARAIVVTHGGKLPKTYTELVALPSIGPYTAGALLAFVWNTHHVIIETNIRTAYIHHFFPTEKVSDTKLLPLIEVSLDKKNPREWYYALMDYGSHIKKTIGNVSRASLHYKKQNVFKGSVRQLRGAILRELAIGNAPASTLAKKAGRTITETRTALHAMTREGLVEKRGAVFGLAQD